MRTRFTMLKPLFLVLRVWRFVVCSDYGKKSPTDDDESATARDPILPGSSRRYLKYAAWFVCRLSGLRMARAGKSPRYFWKLISLPGKFSAMWCTLYYNAIDRVDSLACHKEGGSCDAITVRTLYYISLYAVACPRILW